MINNLAMLAAIDPDEPLTTEQAAELLGVSSRWLRKLRQRKHGPEFYRIGYRIRYRCIDLLTFLYEPRGGNGYETGL